MDILSTILHLTQEYELKCINSLNDDKQEILRLRQELNNMRENVQNYISKIYYDSTEDVQVILDNICLRLDIKK